MSNLLLRLLSLLLPLLPFSVLRLLSVTVALSSSAIIHFVMSKLHPQDFDWNLMNEGLVLVEADMSGLDGDNAAELKEAKAWIIKRGYILTFILIIAWPLLSVPAGVFTKSYFCFWVFLAIVWGCASAVTITVLPLWESWDEIRAVVCGIVGWEFVPSDTAGAKVVEADTTVPLDKEKSAI